MDKHAAAHVLEQIAACLELKGENEFRVRAYRNAAHAVETYGGELAAGIASGALGDLKGVGPATLEVLREFVATGRSSALEQLKREVPAGLVEMLRIAGLGVAKIRTIHLELGIATIAELEEAAGDGRLAQLPRFGARTAQKILRGIAYLRRTGEFHLLHHALRQAESFRRSVAALPGVSAVEIVGSVRRRCELVRDIDLAIAAGVRPGQISERLAAFPGVKDVAGAGDATFAVHFDDGITTKVYVGPPQQFGHLLVRTTGNRAHLDALVRAATARGFALDEHGLARDGALLPCPDEAALYRAIGLEWVPPELREDLGEVVRAATGTLPKLVERGDLAGFVHCHTVASDGTTTVAQLVDACRAAGYRYLGITDHSESAAYAGGL
jgi:DNA polymerase (family 10)